MNSAKLILFSLLLSVYSFYSTAQSVPGNDLCADAIPLSVFPASICLSPTMGTIAGAQSENDVSSCDYFGYFPNQANIDVWYTFTAPATGFVGMDLLDIYGNSYNDLYYSILDGTCGNFTEVVCGFSNSGINLSLSPGATYTIRVMLINAYDDVRVSSNSSFQIQNGDFTICLYEPICIPTLTLSGFIPIGNYITANTIFSDGYAGYGVYYEAGDFIELQNGFMAYGNFEAVIGGCN